MRCRVQHHVPQHADVVHAAVDFERVVVKVGQEVVVEIDADRAQVPHVTGWIRRPALGGRPVRIAVGLDVDAVVKVGDVVVGDDVAGTVDLHRHIGRHGGRKFLAVLTVEGLPHRAGPADHPFGIVAADEDVVGDVEVVRTGIVGPHASTDVLEAAALDGQPFRSNQELCAGENAVLGVPERDPLEVVMVSPAHVEQCEVTVAVEDHLAVARRLDRDRPLRCPVRGEVVRPVERLRAVHDRIGRVLIAVVFVDTGMNEQRVTRTHARPPGRRVVRPRTRQVVGAQQAFKCRLGFCPSETVRVDMERPPITRGHWLRPRADGDDLARFAAHAVRISQHELRLVARAGLEIQDAAGKHVRHGDVDLPPGLDALSIEPQQRQPRSPRRLAGLPIRHVNSRRVVGVALDQPLKPEIDQRRRVDDKFPWRDPVRPLRRLRAERRHPNRDPDDSRKISEGV